MARPELPFKIEQLSPFKRKPGNISKYINPFNHDHFRMGKEIGENIIVMYDSHNRNDHVVIVDRQTGARIKVWINSAVEKEEDIFDD